MHKHDKLTLKIAHRERLIGCFISLKAISSLCNTTQKLNHETFIQMFMKTVIWFVTPITFAADCRVQTLFASLEREHYRYIFTLSVPQSRCPSKAN